MRARLLAALVLAALLAGCAKDPPPLVAGEPSYSDAEMRPGAPLAPLRWTPLAQGGGVLAPLSPLHGAADVPNGTLTISVNLTLKQGAIRGLVVALGECQWRRDVNLVGAGQEVAADCGGLGEGESAMQVIVDAGAMNVDWTIVALTCDPREGRCPPRAPVGS